MTKPLFYILNESVIGSLTIIKNLAIVIIPMMIAIQIMVEYKLLEKLSTKTKFITDFLGVSKDTLVALLIGIFAGITYGAGAIYDAQERFNLNKRDIFLIMCFLVTFHGIIEITLIFWIIGVNPAAALGVRLIVAAACALIMKTVIGDRFNS